MLRRKLKTLKVGDKISLIALGAEIERGNAGDKRAAWWNFGARKALPVPGMKLNIQTNDTHYVRTA
jgi:hypothetical protein